MITRFLQPMIPQQRERVALYRFWGADGALLYVGISNRPDLRWAQHAADKPWWGQVAHKEVCAWYSSRRAAEQAESMAIRCELPRYNIMHNERNPYRVAYRPMYRTAARPTYRPTEPWYAYVPWPLAAALAVFLLLMVVTVAVGPFAAIGLAGAGMLAAGVVWPERRRRRRRRRR